MTTSKIPTLEEIQEEMLDLETSQDRMGYLIELGDSLPPFPPEWCVESNRVLGCQSMVWLVPDIQGERISFLASSDAPMVRGLIAILMAAYSGKRSSEILSIPPSNYLRACT